MSEESKVLIRADLMASLSSPPGKVACNGCTRCCRGDAVRLLPGDDVADYEVELHQTLKGEFMLAHKSNGDCVYLGKSGCDIHGRRPQMCREMDCRVVAFHLSFTDARKLDKQGKFPMMVWRKGRELLDDNLLKENI